MLAGHPFAGKSMLVSGLLRALETGAPFVGRKTKAASALLVTEEDQASLRERAGGSACSESEASTSTGAPRSATSGRH
jgi:hypothetical protein